MAHHNAREFAGLTLGGLDESQRIQEKHGADPGKNDLSNHARCGDANEAEKQTPVKTTDDADDERDDKTEAFAIGFGDEAADQTGNRTYKQDDERGIEVHDLGVTSPVNVSERKALVAGPRYCAGVPRGGADTGDLSTAAGFGGGEVKVILPKKSSRRLRKRASSSATVLL